MPLAAGTRLGPYEIGAPLGKGGMGEVYRARDTKLGREVAIKILPEELAADEERVARFEREAKLLASMNHPNIAGIYGLEESDGVQALVLELVEGPTLAERIARGSIPVEEAIAIAKQIAEALETGHEAGVVHRDLKPANVKVKDDGTVKVLDYGLAKALEEDGPSGSDTELSQSPTLTRQGTQVGVILGTAPYMSPEQAKGKRVDKRTDIFAFGALLYEMLSGKRAFPGEDISDILAAVLKTEPDPEALPPGLDPRLRRLLERCSKKDPRYRLRDIGDARLELEEIATTPYTASVAPASSSTGASGWRRVLPWAVAFAAAVGAIASYVRKPPARPAPAQVQIELPPGVVLPVDTEHPVLALSPDGNRLIFVGELEGVRRLYLRELARGEARVITGTEEAASPFFSPDGRWIGFLTNESIKKVSLDGGVPIAVHPDSGPFVNQGSTWSSTDTLFTVWSPNDGLSRASLAGDSLRVGEYEYVTQSATAWPSALPGGRYVLYTDTSEGSTDEASLAALDVETLESRTLVRGATSPRYATTGDLLFARDGAIYAASFDASRAEVTGAERKLLDGVMSSKNGAAQFTVGGSGTLAYVAGGTALGDDELVWVDRDGNVESIFESGQLYQPQLSPDGRRVMVTSRTGANVDLWVYDLERATFTRLTTDPGEDVSGVWSPDGTALALASEIQAPNFFLSLAWMPDLSATPEVLVPSTDDTNWSLPSSWSPDGRFLAFTMVRDAVKKDVWLYPIGDGGGGTDGPIPFLDSPANERDAAFSPDGKWIAYASDVSGRNEVYIRSVLKEKPEVTLVSSGGGAGPIWSRDGRELFYRLGYKVMAVSIGGGDRIEPTTPRALFEGRFRLSAGEGGGNYDVSPDGRFLMVRAKDLVTPDVIHVVFDWPEALAGDSRNGN
ncbi:MAG TPA: protein kinase [Vicinamibacteria bacterium]|nr:protein kinase [Vicinamibacteria bacterium]